ncbi:MAG: tetratricopeptide repeat protein, partial [Ktedonobacteraceae bacterium]
MIQHQANLGGRTAGYMASWSDYIAFGRNAYKMRKYPDAEQHFRDALAVAQSNGADQSKIAESLINLGLACKAQNKYSQAEEYYEKGVRIYEATASSSTSLAAALNNLSVLYKAEAKYTDAELMYRRALGISEREHGEEHAT